MLRWIRARLSRDDGVSLVEMLVAMLIVGFVLMALASTTTASLASMRGTERHTRGTHYGNELVERMHSLGWNDLTFYASDCPAPAGRPACPPELSSLTPMFEGNTVVLASTARPAGSQAPLPTEWVTTAAPEGSVRYAVTRYITWIDDPSDGTAAAGTDSNPQDYKRLTVLLNWTVDGKARSQRFDSHRAPPLDGPTATSPFRIVKVDILPTRSILLDALKRSTTGAVDFEITVSRVASDVTIELSSDGGATWTSVTPVSNVGQIVWTASIPASRVWDPQGYWNLRVTATPPSGAPEVYDERLWIAQTEERFVAVLDFTASPGTRLDRYHHSSNMNHRANNDTNCAVALAWTVTRDDPADVITTTMTAATYKSDGTTAMAPWQLPITSTTTLSSTSVRYTAGIASGTKVTGDRITFTAFAKNAVGDSDTVTRERALTYNLGCL